MEPFFEKQQKNQPESVSSLLQEPLRRFLENDPSFRVHKLINLLKKTTVEYNPNTWVSVMSRSRTGEDNHKITIGLQAIPESLADQWNMGSKDKSEQLIFKLAHELSHAFQIEKGYEGALVDFLNGSNDISDKHIPFIELYVFLSKTGHVNGLASASIYEEQSRRTGNLKMETLEDMTELMASYLISDEYLLYRLERSVTELNQEQKTEIARKVIEILFDVDKQ